MKLKFLILLILLSTTVGLTQDLDSRLLRLVEKNKINELRANLDRIKQKYPDNPILYYIEAFVEKDGEKAVPLYKDFIKRFPQNPYIVNAKYKIAQYYYAKGLYRSAKQLLDNIIKSHTHSLYMDDSYYLKIRCLIALEQTNQVKSEIKYFIKNYPHSPFKKLAEYDLTHLNKPSYSPSTKNNRESSKKKIRDEIQNYAIQVGAYSNRDNAINQMKIISNWGYSAEIFTKVINHKLYYLVWVGNFETEEQALNFGAVFKKKYGLPFHLVRKVTND